MPILKQSRTVPVVQEEHIVAVRQAVRQFAVTLQLSLVDQTKVVTAASELARNLLIYGGGGKVELEMLEEGSRRGIRVHFIDEGPGIPDVELALRDGFTSGNGMGLGLGGARRLVNEFSIDSAVGRGTHITITRWR